MAEPEKGKREGEPLDPAHRKLMEQVVQLYQAQKEIDSRVSLSGIGEACAIHPLKVRKLLITAGIYENSVSREIAALWKEGRSAREIQEQLGLSPASVHSYLPYSRVDYGVEGTLNQEREQRIQTRRQAREALAKDTSLQEGDVSSLDQRLWDTMEAFQGVSFSTAKDLRFTYSIRGNEMFVSRKDKSITKATVLLAFHRAIDLQRNGRKITGPKMLGTFGASYLFPIFLQLGVIDTGRT